MSTDTRAGTRRRLPIGMQTFRELREQNCYYVDKTAFIARLLDEGKHYFLSRPRRFGKSLFLDTCKELFEGNQALFERLAIADDWDWSVRHPVLRLSFGSGNFKDPDHLPATLMAQLDSVERETGVVSGYASASDRFGHMLGELHRQAGRPVAVLVDEYDKPILDALGSPEVARANRDFLRGLYATIKDCDAHVRFTFLAGVSKFSKVSLFSGLNNLKDITLDPRYSAICGYTDADLDTVFAPELPGLDRDEIREWYNGYSWRGDQKVYNPFDILLLFDTREFDAYWFETGTPSFLIETLVERGVSALALDGMVAGIPYEWYTNNDIARFEGYYASVFYAYFASVLGIGITVEDSADRGRADMAVRFGGRVYLFEFKVIEQAGPGAALAQLKAKAYADKYRGQGEPIHLIGVEFSSASRNVVTFDHEIA